MSDAAQERPPQPQPVFARAPLLDGLVPAEEAFSVILFECLAHAGANVPAVLAGNSDGLHQLRVGLRRLRSALSTFGKSLPDLTALNQRAKALTNAVGPARDLDVFLSDLFAPAVAQLGGQHGFEILRQRAERARDRAWAQAMAEIAKPDFAKFQDDVAAAASAKLWAGDGRLSLAAVAPDLMARHLKRAKRRGQTLLTAAPPERHRLRIALKKLRYTGEFFAPLYAPKAVTGFMGPLKELQDLLGHLNDAAQVRSHLGRLMMEETGEAVLQADLSHATGLLLGWHQAQADRLLAKTAKRWKAFKKAEVFWV